MAAPRKYPDELRERATRWRSMPGVILRRGVGALKRIGEHLGINLETLRNWVIQVEIDDGHRPGTTTDDTTRLAELEREVRELRRTDAILRSASAFWGRGSTGWNRGPLGSAAQSRPGKFRYPRHGCYGTMPRMPTPASAPGLSRSRSVSVRVLAALGLVTYSLLFVLVAAEASGIMTFSPVGSPDDPPPSPEALAGAAAPAEVVHLIGALAGLALGTSGLIALLLRPQRPAASRQVLAAALASLVVAPLVGNPDNVGGQAGVIDPVFLVLAIPPLLAALVSGPFHGIRSGPLRPLLLILAAMAFPVAAWWGVGQALNQRNTFPPIADPHHQAHWHAMAVFAFAVVLVVAAAAFGGRGWRLGATTAGLSATAFGVASIAAPAAASAVAPVWAVTALVWGGAVLSATWLEKPAISRKRSTDPGALSESLQGRTN